MPKQASPRRGGSSGGKKKSRKDWDDKDIDPAFLRPAVPFGSEAPLREYYPLPHHQADIDSFVGLKSDWHLNRLTEGEDPTNPPPHTNTVRYVLSTSRDLTKVARQRTRDDSGHWWVLSKEADFPVITPGYCANKRGRKALLYAPKGNPISLQRRAQKDPWVHHNAFPESMEPAPSPPRRKIKKIQLSWNQPMTAHSTQFRASSFSELSDSPSPIPTPTSETRLLPDSPSESNSPFQLPSFEYMAQAASRSSPPGFDSYALLPGLQSLGLLDFKRTSPPPPPNQLRFRPY
ncbi:hypothetical protein M422DRAFT_41142 [Sphaerobolus stellatus SS14]|nr:hypothetical protein M422DRAFT_41142 [Sphaerobolus stellatus SS14]